MSRRPLYWVVGLATVSLSAQALSLPLVASTFGSVPLLSPLVNVPAIPLASALVPLGFLAALAGLVLLPLAAALNGVTGLFAGALIWLADVASNFPTLLWGEIAPVEYTFYALGALAVVLAVRGLLRPWRALLVLCTAILCSMLTLPTMVPPEMIVFDVGQDDSTLLRLPGRVEILVDGGGSPFSD